jgi:hypothetical protein
LAWSVAFFTKIVSKAFSFVRLAIRPSSIFKYLLRIDVLPLAFYKKKSSA